MPSTLRLYDLQSSRVREVPGELAPGSSAQGVSRFSPDGSIFAAAYEEQLDLWDIRADQIRRIPDRLPPLGWQSRTFQFSADGATMTTAAAAHVDKEPRVWGTRTGRMLGALSGHSGGVAAVYYGGDGTIRTVGERDGTVRVYAVPG
jgi:WD40 repeat protein